MAGADWIAERGWVRPDHGGACFAALPGTITQLLTGEAIARPLPSAVLEGFDSSYPRIVFVYVDALSFTMASRHADHPLLARAANDGIVTRLTSQFPSTTTAQMPTIHSGLPVGEHGLYEWFILEPSLDRLIAPLPFTFAGDGQEPLEPHLRPQELFPERTIYEWLGERGVRTIVSGAIEFAATPASGALLRGASDVLSFVDLGDGLQALARALAALPTPAYGFVYIDDADSLMHRVGPGTPVVDSEVEYLLSAIERCLLRALPAGTLLLMTSDHGMSPVSPRHTTYLNVGAQAARIESLLRRGAEPGGHVLAPAGSCRDLFLHVAPGHLDDCCEALEQLLGSRAEVRRTHELINAGLFGPEVSPALTARLGDLVVLPEFGEAVYWYTPGRFRQTLWGQHGGLTPDEMEIPLIGVVAE